MSSKANNPHVIQVFISPFIGELQHTGDFLSRHVTDAELAAIQQSIPSIQITESSYVLALLKLKKILEVINNGIDSI